MAKPEYTIMIADKGAGKFLVGMKSARALYTFTSDADNLSNCKDGCLTVWPQFLAELPVAPSTVSSSLFGTITRPEGSKQSTFNKKPLYYFQSDVARGAYTDENKQLALRWFELISEGNVDEICELTDPTWVMHGGKPGMPPGPDGVRELFASFGEIEQTWTLEDVIAEGNKVVVRAFNTCKQVSFFGIPSGGRWQHFSATFIHQIENGKFIETWRNADDLGRVLQLGARLDPPAKPFIFRKVRVFD